MHRATYALSAMLTALGLTYAATALTYPFGSLDKPGPAFYPLLVVVPLLLLAAAGLVGDARRIHGSTVDWPQPHGWVRISIALGAVTFYVVASPIIGHAHATGLLCVALLSIFRLWRMWVRLLVASAIAVGSDILFSYVLGARLPRGPFGWYW